MIEGKRDSTLDVYVQTRTRLVASGRGLRLITRAPAWVRYTIDGWQHQEDIELVGSGFSDLRFADLPLAKCQAGTCISPLSS